MSDFKKKDYERYKKLAEEHADFLCEKVFKPAFHMAFLHGAKHMFNEMSIQIEELNKVIDEEPNKS